MTSTPAAGCEVCERTTFGVVVHETSHAMIAVPYAQRTRFAAVVVPNRHIESLADANDDEVAELFSLARHIALVLEKEMDVDGLNTWIDAGRIDREVFGHLLLELVPRYVDDDYVYVHRASLKSEMCTNVETDVAWYRSVLTRLTDRNANA